MVIRMMKGKSPFHADRTHIHHILMRAGFSKTSSVLIIVLISSIFTLLGILGTIYRVPDYLLFLCFVSYFVLNMIFFRIFPLRLSGRTDAGSAGLQAETNKVAGLDLKDGLAAVSMRRK
jgi:hypothetical protein